MKQIRIVFETGTDKKIGYILDAEKQHCTGGTFNEDCTQIVEKTQDGLIDNPEELCKQIYYVLLTGLKNG